MALPIEPFTVTGTRPTATITRAEMEGRAGLDNTSDEDIVNLASSHESNDEQVTEGYSNDVSSVVEQVREENEDIWCYLMQSVLCFNCLGDKCLLHAI